MKKGTPHVIGAQVNNYLVRTAQMQVEMRRKAVVLERVKQVSDNCERKQEMHGKQIQHVGKLRIPQIGD